MKFLFYLSVIFINLFVAFAVLSAPAVAVDIGEAFKIDDIANKSVNQYEHESVGEFIGGMIPNVMMVSNLILFFLILFGGFLMITNSGDPKKQAMASAIITSALFGFLIIFGAYWLIQILSASFGYDILGPSSTGP